MEKSCNVIQINGHIKSNHFIYLFIYACNAGINYMYIRMINHIFLKLFLIRILNSYFLMLFRSYIRFFLYTYVK